MAEPMPAPAAVEYFMCPSWCISRHDDDNRDVNYRQHRAAPLTGPGGLYVEVTRDEPLNSRAAYLAKGPRVYFAVQPGEGVSLSALQANGLAFTLSRMRQYDAARLLGEAVKLATGEMLQLDAGPADEERATVTEYGVHFWSRTYGKHHVDECRDLNEALSSIALIRRKVDAGALLVSREVPAPGPVGEWRAVSPDDAAVAFETAKAAAR